MAETIPVDGLRPTSTLSPAALQGMMTGAYFICGHGTLV